MKINTLGTVTIAIASAIAVSLVLHISPLSSTARAEPVLGGEQYKVLNTENMRGAENIEAQLNALSKQGWKVKSGAWPMVILVK